jgi:glycosyltransferase involved in cell wall biosynthesis
MNYQQNAIDRIKGVVARPVPKEWLDARKFKPEDGDDEVTIIDKQINANIAAETKPWFFIYRYSHLKTELDKYVKSVKSNCKIRFGKSLDELYADENKSEEEKNYSKYNNIICVSDLTSERFKDVYPQYAEKTIAICNPQSEEFIIKQSLNNDNDISFTRNGFTLISIGRIDSIKRFTEIPQIASFLASQNIKFKWYIIGDGAEEEKRKIQENITKEKVEEYVVCLGVKTNPHYYIKNADLLVSLSISEACPRVINEAKILHVPVVCTNFDTAKEFIENMENGLISPIEEIKYSILEILQNKELNNKIRENISNFHFDNEDIMNNINKIL